MTLPSFSSTVPAPTLRAPDASSGAGALHSILRSGHQPGGTKKTTSASSFLEPSFHRRQQNVPGSSTASRATGRNAHTLLPTPALISGTGLSNRNSSTQPGGSASKDDVPNLLRSAL